MKKLLAVLAVVVISGCAGRPYTNLTKPKQSEFKEQQCDVSKYDEHLNLVYTGKKGYITNKNDSFSIRYNEINESSQSFNDSHSISYLKVDQIKDGSNTFIRARDIRDGKLIYQYITDGGKTIYGFNNCKVKA